MISCGILIDTCPARKGRKGVGGKQLGEVPFQPRGRLWAGIWGPAVGEGSENAASISLESHDGIQKRY